LKIVYEPLLLDPEGMSPSNAVSSVTGFKMKISKSIIPTGDFEVDKQNQPAVKANVVESKIKVKSSDLKS
jgi:hypothetical protein